MTGASSGCSSLRRAVEEAIHATARQVILPRFKSLGEQDVSTKSGPNDFVTIADREAEGLLSEKLTEILPGTDVVGEEAAALNPDIMKRIAKPGATWIIDPIDGTGNFVTGLDAFAVVAALVEDGETKMGWIHHPLSGETFWAAKGEGAWRGDRKLNVHTPASVDVEVLKASLYHRAFRDARGHFAKTERMGSAAHEYSMLVENRLQVTSFSRLKPWDHAAGVLIHSEAGGYSAMLDRSPYQPHDTESKGLLSAPSLEIWSAVRALADEQYI